jgi:hypothetical protein
VRLAFGYVPGLTGGVVIAWATGWAGDEKRVSYWPRSTRASTARWATIWVTSAVDNS